ncbi:MAG TPA: hypothetical protein VGR26_14895 [Acidimicrobiales bacterium]|nr:hypothetical protein [Acidimicrobiales bacterium]
MTPLTRAVVATIGVAVVYVGGHVALWAIRTWGLERVAVVLTLAVVGLVLGLVAAAEVRDRRERAEPWVDVPWEVRR